MDQTFNRNMRVSLNLWQDVLQDLRTELSLTFQLKERRDWNNIGKNKL